MHVITRPWDISIDLAELFEIIQSHVKLPCYSCRPPLGRLAMNMCSLHMISLPTTLTSRPHNSAQQTALPRHAQGDEHLHTPSQGLQKPHHALFSQSLPTQTETDSSRIIAVNAAGGISSPLAAHFLPSSGVKRVLPGAANSAYPALPTGRPPPDELQTPGAKERVSNPSP